MSRKTQLVSSQQLQRYRISREKLITLLTYAMDEVAPEIEHRIKVRTEPWINNEILELIEERDRALDQSRKERSNPDHRKYYNKLRNRVTKLIRKTKANFFQDKVEEHKDNPKLLWKQLNTLGYSNKSKEKSRTVLEINGEKCHEPKAVSNHMNNYFLKAAADLLKKLQMFPISLKLRLQYSKISLQIKELLQKASRSQKYQKNMCIKNYVI